MPHRKRHYDPGQLQFITASTHQRAPLFLSERFCRSFVETLAAVRQATKFLLIGWVLMPDHFHLLLKPEPAESTPLIRISHDAGRLPEGRGFSPAEIAAPALCLSRAPRRLRPQAARSASHGNNQKNLLTAGLKPRPSNPVVRNPV